MPAVGRVRKFSRAIGRHSIPSNQPYPAPQPSIKTAENQNAYNASQAAYHRDDTHHKKLLASGYTHDQELSGDAQQVYHHPTSKHTLIGYKGTSGGPNAVGDLAADLNIGIGSQRRTGAFKSSQDIHDRAVKKYGDNLTVTGHSLGGTKAIEAARGNSKTKSIAFNPGSGVAGLDAGDSKVFRRQGDTVSERTYGKNVTKFRSKGEPVITNLLANHSLHAFENDLF